MRVIARAAVLGLLTGTAISMTAEAQQTTRCVRYEQAGDASWGIIEEETIRQLSDAPYARGTATGQSVQRSTVKLLTPVEPRKIFMTAFNFRNHITEYPAEYPGLFLVPHSSIVRPEDPILRPRESGNLHYEAEMVAVIGQEANNVSLEDASDHIFGVSAGNDVSERTWQAGDVQWTRAKGSLGVNAVGPVLVTVPDYDNLDI